MKRLAGITAALTAMLALVWPGFMVNSTPKAFAEPIGQGAPSSHGPQGVGLGLRPLGQSVLGLRSGTQAAFFLEPAPQAAARYTSSVVIDPSGGIHAAMQFTQKNGDESFFPVEYAYCPSACIDLARWSWVQLGDTGKGGTTGSAEVAVTPQGQPRLMWYNDGAEFGEPPYYYAECNSNCTIQDSWHVSGGLPGGLAHTNGVTYFALDPLGRPRYVYPGTYGPVYVACDSGCTDPAHWSQFVTNESSHVSPFNHVNLVFNSSGLPRMLGYVSGTTNDLVYRACTASPCNLIGDWSDVHLAFLGSDGDIDAWSMALDSKGRPRLALYHAYQLYYWWSDGDPLQFSSWKNYQISLPSGKFGIDVDLKIDRGDYPHLAFNYQDLTPVSGLGAIVCVANCQPQSGSAIWGMFLPVETTADLDTIDPISAVPPCLYSHWTAAGAYPSQALDGGGNPFILSLAIHAQVNPNPSSGCYPETFDRVSLRMALIYSDTPPAWENQKLYLALVKK